jgi:hypothetical protein
VNQQIADRWGVLEGRRQLVGSTPGFLIVAGQEGVRTVQPRARNGRFTKQTGVPPQYKQMQHKQEWKNPKANGILKPPGARLRHSSPVGDSAQVSPPEVHTSADNHSGRDLGCISARSYWLSPLFHTSENAVE